MGQTTSTTGGLAASLLRHSVEKLDGGTVPFRSLYRPNGAVIFLVRRMG